MIIHSSRTTQLAKVAPKQPKAPLPEEQKPVRREKRKKEQVTEKITPEVEKYLVTEKVKDIFEELEEEFSQNE